MGTAGTKILKIDAAEVISLLNKAFADEWLAYYQYWIGAKVSKGPMKDALNAELLQHAADELRHAEMVSNRIIQLGGTPLLKPADWTTHTNCGYDAPENPYVTKILDQNIKGEQCAINVYQKIMDVTKDKDMVTYDLAFKILQDEVEHEEDLQALAEDFELMLSNFKNQ
jgi:bacterioferritin